MIVASNIHILWLIGGFYNSAVISEAFHNWFMAIEYIDDARMLTVLGPGGRPTQRLYLDETTGRIDSVSLDIEYAVDARDLLDGTTERRLASLGLTNSRA